MAQARGIFVPALINTKGMNSEGTVVKVSVREQAEQILRKVNYYYYEGYKKVGITCSTNNTQSEGIEDAYNGGGWYTKIGGEANQAKVIKEVERLLFEERKYKHLQNVFRILPITTCAETGGKGKTQDDWLTRDFDNIQNFIDDPNNHVVLGWQNEKVNDTKKSTAPYAIGGDIGSDDVFSPKKKSLVQDNLIKLKTNYPSPAAVAKTAPNSDELVPDTYYKKRVLGGFFGTVLGLGLGVLPFALIFFGIILLPASFGGTAAMIGVGLAMLVGPLLGGVIGYKIGDAKDVPPLPTKIPLQPTRPAQPQPPQPAPTTTPAKVKNDLKAAKKKKKKKEEVEEEEEYEEEEKEEKTYLSDEDEEEEEKPDSSNEIEEEEEEEEKKPTKKKAQQKSKKTKDEEDDDEEIKPTKKKAQQAKNESDNKSNKKTPNASNNASTFFQPGSKLSKKQKKELRKKELRKKTRNAPGKKRPSYESDEE